MAAGRLDVPAAERDLVEVARVLDWDGLVALGVQQQQALAELPRGDVEVDPGASRSTPTARRSRT